jgi:hypothetical protein
MKSYFIPKTAVFEINAGIDIVSLCSVMSGLAVEGEVG